MQGKRFPLHGAGAAKGNGFFSSLTPAPGAHTVPSPGRRNPLQAASTAGLTVYANEIFSLASRLQPKVRLRVLGWHTFGGSNPYQRVNRWIARSGRGALVDVQGERCLSGQQCPKDQRAVPVAVSNPRLPARIIRALPSKADTGAAPCSTALKPKAVQNPARQR